MFMGYADVFFIITFTLEYVCHVEGSQLVDAQLTSDPSKKKKQGAVQYLATQLCKLVPDVI